MPKITSHRRGKASGDVAAAVVVLLLAGSAVSHIRKPAQFDRMIPAKMPGRPRFWTYASAVAEFGITALIVIPPIRRAGAALAAVFLVAVFPGNILDWRKTWADLTASTGKKRAALIRLPLQVPMVAAAIHAARRS